MISVIIPTYNEEKVLPETLTALFRQPGDYEVLVVDGGSTDRTVSVLADFGFSGRTTHDPDGLSPGVHPMHDVPRATGHVSGTLLSAPKGRASQMNVGAKHARGGWLLFLHADTLLPQGALSYLNSLERDSEIQAGGFRHRFSGDDWRLRLISWLDNMRCLRSRIIYGDQALFVRRHLFEQLGGFPRQPILEDVAFGERLLQVTTPHVLPTPVLTDARKFIQMGVWRSLARVLLIILHTEFRLPILPRAFFQDIR